MIRWDPMKSTPLICKVIARTMHYRYCYGSFVFRWWDTRLSVTRLRLRNAKDTTRIENYLKLAFIYDGEITSVLETQLWCIRLESGWSENPLPVSLPRFDGADFLENACNAAAAALSTTGTSCLTPYFRDLGRRHQHINQLRFCCNSGRSAPREGRTRNA